MGRSLPIPVLGLFYVRFFRVFVTYLPKIIDYHAYFYCLQWRMYLFYSLKCRCTIIFVELFIMFLVGDTHPLYVGTFNNSSS